MAFLCTDDFESYADGANLGNNTAAGGSGWTSNWGSAFTGPATVVTTQAQGGTKSAQVTANQINRDFSSVTAGILYFYVRYTGTDDNAVWLRDAGASNIVATRFNTSNFQALINGTYTTQFAASINTWYKIGVEINDATQSGKVRYNVDDGAWGAWVANGVNSGATAVTRMLIWGTTTNLFTDTIAPGVATTVSKRLTVLGAGA